MSMECKKWNGICKFFVYGVKMKNRVVVDKAYQLLNYCTNHFD